MLEKIEDAKNLLDKNNIAYKNEDDGKSGIYVHFKDPTEQFYILLNQNGTKT